MIDFFFFSFVGFVPFRAIVIYVVYYRDSSVQVIYFIFGRPINVYRKQCETTLVYKDTGSRYTGYRRIRLYIDKSERLLLLLLFTYISSTELDGDLKIVCMQGNCMGLSNSALYHH